MSQTMSQGVNQRVPASISQPMCNVKGTTTPISAEQMEAGTMYDPLTSVYGDNIISYPMINYTNMGVQQNQLTGLMSQNLLVNLSSV